MALKTIIGFAAALAAVGADALVCRPGSSSVALSSSLTASTSVLETSTATVSESSSASTTASITISTTEEPTSSTTTSSVPASCPTEGLVCGASGYVVPNMSVKFTSAHGADVQDCKAMCLRDLTCVFVAVTAGNSCFFYTVPSGPAGFQRAPVNTFVGYDRACFVC